MELLQILTELEHSGVGRNKEQSARMLGHLVSNAPRLIRPYMEPILKVRLCCFSALKLYVGDKLGASFQFLLFCFQALILKLKDPDPNPAVVISVLATIGELAQVRTRVFGCFNGMMAGFYSS